MSALWYYEERGKMKRKIAVLFKELCCSQCKSDFDEESVLIMRQEDEMIVFKLICSNCGKSFGVAFLGISDFDLKGYSEDDLALNVQEGAAPIGVDDVLNAHKFIKELDDNWKKFIKDIGDET